MDTQLKRLNNYTENELLTLFGKRVKKYTKGESSSITVETARELMSSMLYTLSSAEGYYPDIDGAFASGTEALIRKKKEQYVLWKYISADPPAVTNVFYDDTIRNIGVFFRKYDVYYMSHQIPCSIDYPLLVPVSEELLGIDYIAEYLKRIYFESAFLEEYSPDYIRRLYESSIPRFREGYFNLAEGVFINALGCSLIGLNVRELDISFSERKRIEKLVSGLEADEIRIILQKAADSSYASRYLKGIIPELALRIYSSKSDLSKIFVEFLPDGTVTDTI